MSNILLVDKQGNGYGTAQKMEVHQKGLLHCAFSIFIFNASSELLLQQRSLDKYHCPGLWSNTCCSHPLSEKSIRKFAEQRLSEEMGFRCFLRFIFNCLYKLNVGNSMIEHEYNHVFIGNFENNPNPDPSEVMDWKWASHMSIQNDLSNCPTAYTPWFIFLYTRVRNYLRQKQSLEASVVK